MKILLILDKKNQQIHIDWLPWNSNLKKHENLALWDEMDSSWSYSKTFNSYNIIFHFNSLVYIYIYKIQPPRTLIFVWSTKKIQVHTNRDRVLFSIWKYNLYLYRNRTTTKKNIYLRLFVIIIHIMKRPLL